MWTACLIVLLAQDPEPAKAPAPESRPVQLTKPWTDAEAKTALAEFDKENKRKNQKLANRLAAVGGLANGSNKLLVKPLADAVRSEKHVSVRALAAEALAQQPPAAARPQVLDLIRTKDITDQPAIATALVVALGRTGYQTADWPVLEELFSRELAPERVNVQRAILKLVAEQKEKQSVRLLLQHVDEPFPSDIHGASNPPTEYWEKRWKAWKQWRPEVLEGLYVLTGQRFHSADEAKRWIAANGAKIGLQD